MEGALPRCGPGPKRTQETKGGSAPWRVSSSPPIEMTWESHTARAISGSPFLRRGGRGCKIHRDGLLGSWKWGKAVT